MKQSQFSIFILSLVCVMTLFFVSCEKEKADEVKKNDETKVELEYTTSQNVIVQEFTSTGCSGCGSWGIVTFENFIEKNPSAVPLAVHIKYGDRFITEESNQLGNNRVGRRFTPQISVGNEPCVILAPNNYIDGEASVKKMQEVFDSLTKKEQEVKIAAIYKLENGKVNIQYGAEVLDEADGEYFLTAYVMENGFSAYQTGGDSLQIHNHILRASTDGAFGTSISGKMEFEKTMDLAADWDWSNVYVTAIVWKRNGNVYSFENAVEAKKL